MKQAKKEAVTDRRSFLKLAGASARGRRRRRDRRARRLRKPARQSPRPSLYRETEHIQALLRARALRLGRSSRPQRVRLPA